jgi:hypothetical protein
VAEDERFGQIGIYLAGYYTAIDAGRYELRNAADELLAALTRGGSSSVLSRERFIFVCHSTGGLVVRYILTSNDHLFVNKTIGLVLIASPSSGSRWANRFGWLTSLFGHSIGKQLASGHWTTREIDAQFKNLLNERRIPRLMGVEAYENHFIVHRKWLPDKKVIVTEESAGRYFGAPKLLRGTNHFSTVKPTNRDHPAYELLLDFFEKHFGNQDHTALSDAAVVSFVFERYPSYPILRFSVCNNSDRRVQVSGLRVFKVASVKDEHGPTRGIFGPRMKLEYQLKSAMEGLSVDLFRGQVSNLEPGASEAFQIELDSENTVSLIDFEAECVIASTTISKAARPQHVVLVHAPTDDADGQIAVLDRTQLFESLLAKKKVLPWRACSYENCQTHEVALVRGAATLGFNAPADSWERLRRSFESTETFGFILASYADGLEQGFVPESVKTYLAEWISDPNSIKRTVMTDYEVPAVTVIRALSKLVTSAPSRKPTAPEEPCVYEIGLLDRLLEVSSVIDEPEDNDSVQSISNEHLKRTMGRTSLNLTRADLMDTIAKRIRDGATEFLVASLVVQPQLYHELHKILSEIVQRKKEIVHYDEDVVVADWWDWWQKNQTEVHKSLQWRGLSPRLAKAFEAFQTTHSVRLTEYVLDKDEVVRFAAARGPALSLTHLEILAHDPRPLIRLRVVRNSGTPVELLRKLANDGNSIVRRWVTNHPNVDEGILRKLEHDPVEGVRKFVSKS